MEYIHCNTESRKGKHLNFEERVVMQTLLKEGRSICYIAQDLRRPRSTIYNELKRGNITLYNGRVNRYKAKVGQAVYERNRKRSVRPYKLVLHPAFAWRVAQIVETQKASLDTAVSIVKREGTMLSGGMVCTKTLYNSVDSDYFPITSMDLPDKLKRNTKKHKPSKNKRIYRRSIDERPIEVDTRQTFGLWEIDTVIGKKDKTDGVVLTLLERKTCNFISIEIASKDSACVLDTMIELRDLYGDRFNKVFRTITADNGSEFANLTSIEAWGTKVYFAHPYSSWERPLNELHNRFLRRFIPKGIRIDNFTPEQVIGFSDTMNQWPRRSLGYASPEELFEQALDIIYAA